MRNRYVAEALCNSKTLFPRTCVVVNDDDDRKFHRAVSILRFYSPILIYKETKIPRSAAELQDIANRVGVIEEAQGVNKLPVFHLPQLRMDPGRWRMAYFKYTTSVFPSVAIKARCGATKIL